MKKDNKIKKCRKKIMYKTMHQYKHKKLRARSKTGKKIVANRKQAIAIGLSVAKKKCGQVKKTKIKSAPRKKIKI